MKLFDFLQALQRPGKVGIREKICFLPRENFFPRQGTNFSINSSKMRLKKGVLWRNEISLQYKNDVHATLRCNVAISTYMVCCE